MNSNGASRGEILAVDDNPANLRLLSDLLSGQGYTVRAATDGAKALRAITLRAPDLILLDIRMPGMDGIQVCERLKAETATRAIPVIFVSAMEGTAEKLRGFAAGGVDYVTKPFAPEEVLARVRTHLALHDLQLRLEQRVAERTQALAHSNEQLRQYAEVAAHQLQEPLRLIASYAQLLSRRYRGHLDADADEFIGYIVKGAGRLQRLLGDLLLYSDVGGGVDPEAGQATEVDCERLLGEVLEELGPRIREGGAVVEHSPLPAVPGEREELRKLFTHLIANALAFHGDRSPRVEISARPEDGRWRFTVRDQGPGIPACHHERIFRLFSRLQGAAEMPGTGMGLALSKRIVERHGGRIWVESAEGQGAAFHFVLPGRGVEV